MPAGIYKHTHKRHIDLTGQKFGKLIVYKRIGTYVSPSGGGRMALWLAKCDCGKETHVTANSLRRGATKSCGCQSKEQLKKGSLYLQGKRRPDISGSKCHLWKGGITPINTAIRKSLEYRVWRREVYKRDGYKCVICGYMGNKLQADHIKPFSAFPKLRFELSNGRTLCESCHHKTETWGEGAKKYKFNFGALA